MSEQRKVIGAVAQSVLCAAASLVGVALVVDVFARGGDYSTVRAVVGVALAVGGAWYSGLFDRDDDPDHPLRRWR